ncbi:unnamed protein product [Pedinophyceae sp. YPF-701]|nr:unnamed protein product [Pedinophyceae sp. YPF-701]
MSYYQQQQVYGGAPAVAAPYGQATGSGYQGVAGYSGHETYGQSYDNYGQAQNSQETYDAYQAQDPAAQAYQEPAEQLPAAAGPENGEPRMAVCAPVAQVQSVLGDYDRDAAAAIFARLSKLQQPEADAPQDSGELAAAHKQLQDEVRALRAQQAEADAARAEVQSLRAQLQAAQSGGDAGQGADLAQLQEERARLQEQVADLQQRLEVYEGDMGPASAIDGEGAYSQGGQGDYAGYEQGEYQGEWGAGGEADEWNL